MDKTQLLTTLKAALAKYQKNNYIAKDPNVALMFEALIEAISNDILGGDRVRIQALMTKADQLTQDIKAIAEDLSKRPSKSDFNHLSEQLSQIKVTIADLNKAQSEQQDYIKRLISDTKSLFDSLMITKTDLQVLVQKNDAIKTNILDPLLAWQGQVTADLKVINERMDEIFKILGQGNM